MSPAAIFNRSLTQLHGMLNNMAYAIARAQGAQIGKADFDGYHLYAQGFSFEATTLR